MDIVTNATRSSSNSVELSTNSGKESSSPFDTTNNQEEIHKHTFDENSHQYKIRGHRNCKGHRGRGRLPREPRKPRELNPNKQLEILSSHEKITLKLILLGEQMCARQTSGNIINRLKGKITHTQFNENQNVLRKNKELFYSELTQLLLTSLEEIKNESVTSGMLDKIIILFNSISLKEKTANQQNKLRKKIIDCLSTMGFHMEYSDSHNTLRQEFLALSPEERAKVLAGIPL